MKLNPKITIITATYNSESSIFQTLESVSKQSYQNIEHIIIDGASVDNTIKICNTFPHIYKLVSEPDKGIYDAFNKGILMSSGDVIGFLNSDDVLYDSNSIQNIVDGFWYNVDCVFGNLIITDTNNRLIREWQGSPFEKNSFKKGWKPAHPTFYCKRLIYEKHDNYNTTFKIAGDVELMLRFFEIYKISSQFINITLINMKTGGISNQGLKSKWIILKEEIRSFKINEIKFNLFVFMLYKLKKLTEFILNQKIKLITHK